MRHVVHSTEDLIELLAKKAGVKVERARINVQDQQLDGWMIATPDPVENGPSVAELETSLEGLERRVETLSESLCIARERLLCVERRVEKWMNLRVLARIEKLEDAFSHRVMADAARFRPDITRD